MQENELAIAIDGPAAAGKSTVAKMIARQLSYIYIDTGAMYRALTLQAIEQQVNVHDEEQLQHLLSAADIVLKQHKDGQHVFLNGKDITSDIRSVDVSNNVSHVAAHPKIRTEMVKRQQDLASKRGVVMDGRDIGTHVIPDAEIKIFLIASVDERTKRRYEEQKQEGINTEYETLRQEIEERDLIDSKRAVSPLIKAKDAIEINTTDLSIEQVAEEIMQHVKNK